MIPLEISKIDGMRHDMRDKISIIDGFGAFFSLPYLKEHNLMAAIFEGDFRDTDRRVSKNCQDHNIQEVACFSLDENINLGFRIGTSNEELKGVRKNYHTPSYVIFDPIGELIIVSDSDYYWGIAAKPEFVKKVAGRDIPRHLALFDESIAPFVQSKDPHNARIGLMLSRFSEICRAQCNGINEAGDKGQLEN